MCSPMHFRDVAKHSVRLVLGGFLNIEKCNGRTIQQASRQFEVRQERRGTGTESTWLSVRGIKSPFERDRNRLIQTEATLTHHVVLIERPASSLSDRQVARSLSSISQAWSMVRKAVCRIRNRSGHFAILPANLLCE